MTATDLKSFKLDGPLVDLDETLVELFKHEQPKLFGDEAESKCEIVFELPDGSESSQQRAVSFFLYDVRENRELRSTEWEVRRSGDGKEMETTPPPARVDCSYLVTAWATDTFHEHWLLGQVMQVLLRHRRLPPDLLQGSLKDQEPPVRAQPLQSSQLQSVSDLWQAMKGKPKAVLDYTLTISVDVHDKPIEVHPVLEATFDFRLARKCDVLLTSAGDRKIDVIKVVRAVTSLGPKQAMALVESAPVPIVKGVPRQAAETIKGQLEEAGAEADLENDPQQHPV